jgi:hypothetical protein
MAAERHGPSQLHSTFDMQRLADDAIAAAPRRVTDVGMHGARTAEFGGGEATHAGDRRNVGAGDWRRNVENDVYAT